MADVFRNVEYSRDKRMMDNTVPRALLVLAVGLALIGPDPNLSSRSILDALMLMLGLAVSIGVLLFALMQALGGRTPATRMLGIGLLALYGIVIAVNYWDRPEELRRLPYSRMLGGEPLGTVGWAAVIGAVAWLAYVTYRHFRPAPPWLALSPAGITYRANGLKNLLIPWHEVQDVGDYEWSHAGMSHSTPELTAVLVSREFYEENILPKRSIWDGRADDWKRSFLAKGQHVQVALAGAWFSVAPEDVRAPIEARWKAFRDRPSSSSSATPRAAPSGEPLIHGRWSIDGSPWQAVKFLVPLAGVVAVLVWMVWLR